jgi:hypothetical protein
MTTHKLKRNFCLNKKSNPPLSHSKIPVEQRICPLCKQEIEDEYHFIMKCQNLDELRNKFFDEIISVVPHFSAMNNTEKFNFIYKFKFKTFIDIKYSKWIIIKNNTKYTIQTYKISQLRRQAGVISRRT